ncbi:HAD family hydrolase [Actinomadura sp. 9N407]|uniref:HAD family hydrolase n=1 Tax=Actinomadura sp. 9N407 TaxID=3375154 RepID=UPI0037930655
MKILVLWDIDHTLVSVGGLSGEIYKVTFERVTGRRMKRLADMAGRTDRAITAETLRIHGITPTPEVMATFTDALADAFWGRQSELTTRGQVLSGARDALVALAGRDEVIQSVLTGNMEPIARCKLAAFGLDRFVDFDAGAYGMDDTERPPLVALARERAERKYRQAFGPSTTVLIGDTPKDVEAGHQGGARVVAVATGATSEQQLRDAGAELVLASLEDTAAVVRSVLGVTGPVGP